MLMGLINIFHFIPSIIYHFSMVVNVGVYTKVRKGGIGEGRDEKGKIRTILTLHSTESCCPKGWEEVQASQKIG